MANTTLSMSKIRQILRMYDQGRSRQYIALHLDIARNTVKKYLATYDASGLSFKEVNALDDKALEDFFGKARERERDPSQRMQSLLRCFPHVDKELKRTGMTRKILWEAYKTEFPDGYAYTQFCDYYVSWKGRVNPTMHLDHKVGDKLFVDFAGEKLSYVDRDTGEEVAVEVFVAILAASQLTYVEAVHSQQKEDFISACENTMHYIGGVPQALVPDNLKAAVTKSNRYEPTLNETFLDFANHYGTTILPARAYRPRDKALVEGAVKIMYRRLYIPIRQHTYFSLKSLNTAIRAIVDEHNNQPLKGRNYSRKMQFEEVERQTLDPLPVQRYEFKKIFYGTVMKNSHICLGPDKHYYSVPIRLIGKKIKILYSGSTVEIFSNYDRVAVHKRNKTPYQHSTQQEHLANTHRYSNERTPEKFLEEAAAYGEDVVSYILKIMERKQHPEQIRKSCEGILSLGKKAGADRLANACRKAMDYGVYTYKNIQSILENNMDSYKESIFADELLMPTHDNIRGEDYYK